MSELRTEEIKTLTRGKRNKNGVTMIRTPQFPGLVGQDLSIEQVRAIIRRQKKARGFRFPLVVGANADLAIPISGDARTFLGFAVLFENVVAPALATQMTIELNDEIVIRQVPPAFFTPDFMDDEYYFFPRPLSGQDNIIMNVTNTGGTQDLVLIVYYI